MSRTPMREAVLRLESEGLVKRVRGKGLRVRNTCAKISEVVVIRQALEGAAARLACANARDEEIAALVSSSHQEMAAISQEVSVKDRSQLDWQFHMHLAHVSHSERLIRLIEEFYAYSFSELVPASHPDESALLQRQHIAVADALQQRDANAALFRVPSSLYHGDRRAVRTLTRWAEPGQQGVWVALRRLVSRRRLC